MIVDLFAGPGGWDEGLRLLGRDDVIGWEIDPDAIATRSAAGHKTQEGDVASHYLWGWGPIEGLIASPPCPAFSSAGRQEGMKDIPRLLKIARRNYWSPGPTEFNSLYRWAHPESVLVLEPLRWAYCLRPRWIACEQVKEVLPFWRVAAETLRGWGYRTWTGILNAADYGVPQTRRRAILMASRDVQPTVPPATHSDGGMFGKPWVTMAEALGWAGLVSTGDARLVTGANSEMGGGVLRPYERPTDRPAPTVDTKAGTAWWLKRPATTVCGDQRFAGPGHRDRAGGVRQFDEHAVRVTLEELAILQGFPPGYPWQGDVKARSRQIGNAVPPPLAVAILSVLGLANVRGSSGERVSPM